MEYMNSEMKFKLTTSSMLLLFVIINLCTGCTKPDTHETSGGHASSEEILVARDNLPARIKKIKNLTVYSADKQALDTVEFKKTQVFKSNSDVFIDGYTGDVAIDDQNKVYIVGEKPGTVAIYVFNPDGSYDTKFVREGRGPGEVEAIGSMVIRKDRLYILGPRLQKVCIFSLDDYSFINDFKIGRDVLKKDSLSTFRAVEFCAVSENGKLLMNFIYDNLMDPNRKRKNIYYELSKEAIVQPGKVLKLKSMHYYHPKNQRTSDGYIRLPRVMPFSRSSLVTVSDEHIYTAWTEDFLIRIYDKKGTYQQAFYYSYQNSSLVTSDLNLGKGRGQLISEHKDQVPDTWPALHTIFMDDQNRLWVLTITDSKTHYKGWILNKQGELLAKFDWPGERPFRSVMSKPLMLVKNGYLYTRQRDIREGIDQIVKYKINFKRQ